MAFRPSQRDEKCRICNTLSDAADLYDNHTHNVAQGCPRFVAMGQKKRADIVKKAMLCTSCLDADFQVTKPGVVPTDCQVKAPDKKFYSCSQQDCMKHYLVCMNHNSLNKEKMDKSKLFWQRRGVSFVYHSNLNLAASSKPNKSGPEEEVLNNQPANNEPDVFENQNAHQVPTCCNNEAAEQ